MASRFRSEVAYSNCTLFIFRIPVQRSVGTVPSLHLRYCSLSGTTDFVLDTLRNVSTTASIAMSVVDLMDQEWYMQRRRPMRSNRARISPRLIVVDVSRLRTVSTLDCATINFKNEQLENILPLRINSTSQSKGKRKTSERDIRGSLSRALFRNSRVLQDLFRNSVRRSASAKTSVTL